MPVEKTNKRKRLNIHAVAKLAGVSISTVSRVTNSITTVDPLLAKRVLLAVKELNYSPNNQARALVSGRSRLFGLIISEITNPFFPELIQSFEEISVELGYEILLGSTNYNLENMERCVERMRERNVDGVAVMTFGVERPLLKSLASYGIPLVFVDASPRQALASTIKIDYRLGIRQALEHLSRLGHKDVAFISGPSKYFSAVCRKEAFLEGLKSVGLRLNPAYLREGDHRLEGGQHEMQHLMRLKKPPTAVMCSNDVTALGAMHAAGILRLSVPVDVSIIGFDDIDFTRYSMPPLSSIQMSRKHLARAALMSLVALAEGGTEFTPAVVQTQFVPRESTAPPREKSSESRLSAS